MTASWLLSGRVSLGAFAHHLVVQGEPEYVLPGNTEKSLRLMLGGHIFRKSI
jgi:hypothetical protein